MLPRVSCYKRGKYMAFHQLAGARLLIVEDEYHLAQDAREILSDAGAEIIGPVATIADARAVIVSDAAIDGVLLDVNLRGERAYEIADDLQSRGIPFAFVTGYGRSALPDRFANVTMLPKPVSPDQLIALFSAPAG